MPYFGNENWNIQRQGYSLQDPSVAEIPNAYATYFLTHYNNANTLNVVPTSCKPKRIVIYMKSKSMTSVIIH